MIYPQFSLLEWLSRSSRDLRVPGASRLTRKDLLMQPFWMLRARTIGERREDHGTAEDASLDLLALRHVAMEAQRSRKVQVLFLSGRAKKDEVALI